MTVNLAEGRQVFTSNAFLVDVGANFDVVERLREHADGLDAVVLTHTHPDHVGNLAEVTAAYDVAVYGFDPCFAGVTDALADGETVWVGDLDCVALRTPGRDGDHRCLYTARPGVLFAGDLVFQHGSFGRTDLPGGGDRATLIESLDKLLTAVDDSLGELHPGHGPSVVDEPYRHLELARRSAASS